MSIETCNPKVYIFLRMLRIVRMKPGFHVVGKPKILKELYCIEYLSKIENLYICWGHQALQKLNKWKKCKISLTVFSTFGGSAEPNVDF